jgi:glycosyltransferase involved in cell wall biosynthesis
MEIPLVSVLMTAYNREKYIVAAISSVIASTYRNWELILTDDGSHDSTFELAKGISFNDNRIKIFRNEQNLGDYPNRNKAASLAQGKYLKYLDADDMIYPQSLEIMVDSMEEFPEAALGISQEVQEDYLPYPFLLTPEESYRRQFLKRGVLSLGPSGTIIRTDVFRELGGFSGKRYVGDTELWLKMAARYPVVKMQSGLVFWRRHEGQEYKLGHAGNGYLIMNYQVKKEALEHPGCPLNEADKAVALQRVNYRQSRNLWRILFKRPQDLVRILKETSFGIWKLFWGVFPWRIYKWIVK